MERTTTITELSGHNESPIGGNFITSSNRDFVNRHVVAGSSELYNMSTGESGTVSAVTSSRIDAPVYFKPGDFFRVTLDSDWILQNDDGPVITVECNQCGFSYPRKELVNGLCKTCIDEPRG